MAVYDPSIVSTVLAVTWLPCRVRSGVAVCWPLTTRRSKHRPLLLDRLSA